MSDKRYILSFILIMLLAVSISGCSQAQTGSEGTQSAEAATLDESNALISETSEATVESVVDSPEAVDEVTSTDVPAENQSADALPVETDPNYCLECHIDQERLMAVAAKEDAVASENEGEG